MASSVDGRLSRIEGQLRGLRRMTAEEPADCLQLMTLVHAIKAGVDQVALQLLNEHARTCLLEAVQEEEMGHRGAVDRLVKVFEAFALS